ncbi:hypothetical protein R1flu_010541 [Riccia fluitans]|uniref:PPIase cyclophilin-type domain-containing protein n=1 Tax=Riccia fluitans TaxID=41844 RepID=A0ABD1Z6C9_9MARC
MVEEEFHPEPNGTEFSIAIADSPELNASNLVVGRVVDGWDVLNQMAQVKVVQENTSSPYFQYVFVYVKFYGPMFYASGGWNLR